jgi:hypothetical protein
VAAHLSQNYDFEPNLRAIRVSDRSTEAKVGEELRPVGLHCPGTFASDYAAAAAHHSANPVQPLHGFFEVIADRLQMVDTACAGVSAKSLMKSANSCPLGGHGGL